jgi:uncharacterized RDD family membrane protein YckC
MTAPAQSRPGRAAGIVSRSLAALIDFGVVLAMMGGALVVTAGVKFLWSPISFRWPSPSWAVSLLVGELLAIAYLSTGWATAGRTFGGALLGLRVVSAGGDPLGWARAGLRAMLYVIFPLGLLWVIFSRRRRSVQDVLVRSAVVYDLAGSAEGVIAARPAVGSRFVPHG